MNKHKGSFQAFEKAITRAANISTSEQALIASIISIAFADARGSRTDPRRPVIMAANMRDGLEFFRDGRMDYFANLIDLDPGYVRMLVKDAGVAI